MLIAGIVVDAWKLPVFTRHLIGSGYFFTNAGEVEPGILLLQVRTESPQALHEVVKAAQEECLNMGTVQ